MTTLSPGKQVEVFYDGECPLCMREIRMLQRKDRAEKIQFTNIAAAAFDPTSVGTTYAELMARIHGRLPDGSWIEGVEVFRRLYTAIGWTRLVAFSRWPLVRSLLGLGYRLFAANRLRMTGRCAPDGACAVAPHN
jgi:predicted DCC family thiol-disulfide oxidoreductase YuxK